MQGSTCGGGQMTPFDWASLSLKFLSCAGRFLLSISAPCPTVACVQFSGLFCSALGVTGGLLRGGACAHAEAESAITAAIRLMKRSMAPLPVSADNDR